MPPEMSHEMPQAIPMGRDFLLYDGACPVCSAYVAMTQLRRLRAAMPPEGPEGKLPPSRPSATSPLPLTTPGVSSSVG